MSYPQIIIDLNKIEYNARSILKLYDSDHIKTFGVTKVTCADLKVAEALNRAGVYGLADSRIENLKKMRDHFGKDQKLLMLRLPMHSEVDDVVEYCDYSLNSELSTIALLSEAAVKQGKIHKIILMIDVGDLREGIWPDEIEFIVEKILLLDGIDLVGLGMNLACYGGVIPTAENMKLFSTIIDNIQNTYNLDLQLNSGGNSSGLPFLTKEKMPENITMFRIGETILLGCSVYDRSNWPDTYQDTFKLRAEIIELKTKPSVPIGERGQDAFGNTVMFEDKGNILRAICGIGRQDILVDGIFPVDTDIEILGASSDHLILHLHNTDKKWNVGYTIEFTLSYGALLAAMTSPYVEKIYVGG